MNLYEFSLKMGFVKPTNNWEYEEINPKFRKQLEILINHYIPEDSKYLENFWLPLERNFELEFAVDYLARENTTIERILAYLTRAKNIEILYMINQIVGKINSRIEKLDEWIASTNEIQSKPQQDIVISYLIEKKKLLEFVNQINKKFKAHGIGYEIVNGTMVKIDNQFLHNIVVKQAIQLLYQNSFNTVSEEFMKAFEHYKNSNNKDAINNASKAFESCLKIIAKNVGVEFNEEYTNSSRLIKALIEKQVITSHLEEHLTALGKTLTKGLPMVRDKFSGHGQGTNSIVVNDSMSKYALNLCATNIVYLVDCYQEYKNK